MVGGLRTTTAAAASGGSAVHTMADGGTPAAVSASQEFNSKIDELLQGTGWTREDAEFVLQTISTALLLMWLFSEVLNA